MSDRERRIRILKLKAKAKAASIPSEDMPLAEEPSAIDAIIRGGAQGVSFGFADELSALMSGIQEAKGGVKKAASYLPGVDFEGDADVEAYTKERDLNRAADAAAKEAHPKTFAASEIGSSLLMPGGVLAKGVKGASKLAKLGKMAAPAAGMGGAYSAGISEAETGKELATDVGIGAGLGAATAAVSPTVLKYLGKNLKSGGGKIAASGTGMTGKELQKAGPNVGEELIDRGVIKAFDRPSQIAQRASQKIDEAGEGLSDALEQFHTGAGLHHSESGVTKAMVSKRLSGTQYELDTNLAEKLKAKQFREMSDDIVASIPEEGMPLSMLEKTKQDFGKAGLKFNPTDDTRATKEQMYLSLRDIVEDRAKKLNPEVAEKFKADKQTYGLLKPIVESAERKEAQIATGAWPSFKDIASIGLGASFGGPLGAVTLPIARRVVEPRIKSMAGVSAYRLGQALEKSPEVLGPYTPALQKAAERGVLPVYHNLLHQTDPKYRELWQNIHEDSGDE